MRIVQVAPLEESVPPKKYGGTELVIHNVTEELVKKGHEVYLLGAGDSETSAHLIPILPQSLRKMYSPEEIDTWRDFLKIFHISTILKTIRDLKPDIVHNHYAWRLIQFLDFIDCPVYSTMHGPLTKIQERYVYQQYPEANYISISNNQRKALPELNWVKTIYNGIEVEKFELGTGQRDYFVFLGRTTPDKGLKEIIHMIKKTSHQLKIAAKVDTTDQAYFEQEIKPFIDGQQIEFLGEVDHAGKVALLKKAKALLLWLNWEEPFGLVVTEAMACGTPVIVNRRGSMPELIIEGQTGFLVNTIEEMAAQLDNTDRVSPQDCRAHVEANFSAAKMADEYLELAGKLTGS
ncbi:MAG TPA: glycosyltransferase family 4 protein [Vitreimonas sp.]|nr:glycosyltransferase family 4 protein [Vitreimonas sp.]